MMGRSFVLMMSEPRLEITNLYKKSQFFDAVLLLFVGFCASFSGLLWLNYRSILTDCFNLLCLYAPIIPS